MSDTTTTETDQAPGQALEKIVSSLKEKLASISYADLLKAIAPTPPAISVPAEAPLPAIITDNQKAALKRLPSVFGQVVPDTRRLLEPIEVKALLEERATIDVIAEMVETRKESLRTTVFNHLDVEIESKLGKDEAPPDRDSKGFYVQAGKAKAPGETQCFSREVRGGTPVLTEARLRELADDPEFEDFTHKDYLAMTTETRVLDENKVMLALRKDPKLLKAVAAATVGSNKTNSMFVRKAT